jgi:hypothetical protein
MQTGWLVDLSNLTLPRLDPYPYNNFKFISLF